MSEHILAVVIILSFALLGVASRFAYAVLVRKFGTDWFCHSLLFIAAAQILLMFCFVVYQTALTIARNILS